MTDFKLIDFLIQNKIEIFYTKNREIDKNNKGKHSKKNKPFLTFLCTQGGGLRSHYPLDKRRGEALIKPLTFTYLYLDLDLLEELEAIFDWFNLKTFSIKTKNIKNEIQI